MRFIKHHSGIFRQNAAKIIVLQCQIREKQMMIDDDQIRIARPSMHRGHETVVKVRTLLARTGIAPRIQSRP